MVAIASPSLGVQTKPPQAHRLPALCVGGILRDTRRGALDGHDVDERKHANLDNIAAGEGERGFLNNRYLGVDGHCSCVIVAITSATASTFKLVALCKTQKPLLFGAISGDISEHQCLVQAKQYYHAGY